MTALFITLVDISVCRLQPFSLIQEWARLHFTCILYVWSQEIALNYV